MRFFPHPVLASRIVLGTCLSAISLSAQTPDKPAPEVAIHQAPMVERYGKPYVMVTINGKGPFRFVIDTGTGGDALVTPELAAELGLPTVLKSLAKAMPNNCCVNSTVIASAAKQSRGHSTRPLDCFVARAPRNDGQWWCSRSPSRLS